MTMSKHTVTNPVGAATLPIPCPVGRPTCSAHLHPIYLLRLLLILHSSHPTPQLSHEGQYSHCMLLSASLTNLPLQFVTKEDLENHGKATLQGMTEGFVGGLAAGTAGFSYLRRVSPYYRSLPITIKTLGFVLVIAPAIAAQAERRGVQYDMEHNWCALMAFQIYL